MKTNKNYTILAADDSKMIVSLITAILGDEFTIFPAYSGEEAIELFEKEKPSLILLDVEMPGIN